MNISGGIPTKPRPVQNLAKITLYCHLQTSFCILSCIAGKSNLHSVQNTRYNVYKRTVGDATACFGTPLF